MRIRSATSIVVYGLTLTLALGACSQAEGETGSISFRIPEGVSAEEEARIWRCQERGGVEAAVKSRSGRATWRLSEDASAEDVSSVMGCLAGLDVRARRRAG